MRGAISRRESVGVLTNNLQLRVAGMVGHSKGCLRSQKKNGLGCLLELKLYDK